MSERQCACGASIWSGNTTGHCRRCWGVQLKALSLANPEVEERRRKSVSSFMRTRMAGLKDDPVHRAEMAALARKHSVLTRPENQSKAFAPQAVERRIAARNATVAAMSDQERKEKFSRPARPPSVPERWLETYRILRSKKIEAPTARRMVQEAADAEDRRARRQIAEFDREQRERAAREKAQAY